MEHGYLIVGLGNPGSDYARTRHNAGYLALDALAERWRASWTREKKFKARVAKVDRDGRRVWLCQPQTFMNASGEAVAAIAAFHRVPAAQVLVSVDDADLPLGTLRLRSGGSSGGHHGLESIEQHLATREFARQKIGIGRAGPQAREITGHVLGMFNAAETEYLRKVLQRACEQTECWLTVGIQQAMNQFNGVVNSQVEKGTV